MTLVDRLQALICAPIYALQRSKVAFVRLHVVTVLLALAGIAYTMYHSWIQGFRPVHGLAIGLCAVVVAAVVWAETSSYVIFQEEAVVPTEGTRHLAPEERLFLRGTGNFSVSDMKRYLVEVPVVFWSTELREHILAAKVSAPRLVGMGVPAHERGWWYIFLEPRHVIDIVPGELAFGLRIRPAVRIQRRTDKGIESLYLSCDDLAQLAVLMRELQAKVAAAQGR